MFKTLLILGRVSNLPTVWSNCLCASILGDTISNLHFLNIFAGTSLIYIGGTYLNDYCDTDFDREHCPERPIPSGKIARETVLVLAVLLHVIGLLLIGLVNITSFGYALLLTLLTVSYNVSHKKQTFSVFFMAGCRSCVYFITGAAAFTGVTQIITIAAILMFVYICGITYLARGEHTSRQLPFSVIGRLLAGIALVDMMYLFGNNLLSPGTGAGFVLFFVLALIAQKKIPAT
jgi:4-hydroxybenzoate polyprenyltransferase